MSLQTAFERSVVFASIIIAAAAGLSDAATAEDIGPLILSNADDQSAILVKCSHPQDDTRLRCQSYQLSVRHETEPDAVEKTWRAEEMQFNSEVRTNEDAAKWCAGLRLTDAMKDALAHATRDQRDRINVGGRYQIDRYLKLAQICEKPTASNLRTFLHDAVTESATTCIVTPGLPDTTDFTKVNDFLWTATESGGACNAVTAITLESKGRNKYQWTWTETQVRIDQSNKVCQSVASSKPLVFGSAGAVIPMHCDRVKFGFYNERAACQVSTTGG